MRELNTAFIFAPHIHSKTPVGLARAHGRTSIQVLSYAGGSSCRQVAIFLFFLCPLFLARCNSCGNYCWQSRSSRPVPVPTPGFGRKADDAGVLQNAVHCICRNIAETVRCTVLSKVGKRLEKGSVSPGTRSNQSDRVGPPTPCASPELMKNSNASDFRKTQCPTPGEVYLAIFHSHQLYWACWCGGRHTAHSYSQGSQISRTFCRLTSLGKLPPYVISCRQCLVGGYLSENPREATVG